MRADFHPEDRCSSYPIRGLRSFSPVITILICAVLFSIIVFPSFSQISNFKQIAISGEITYSVSPGIVFYSGFETGDASEWNGDGGGGVYGEDTGGQLNIVVSPVHTGTRAAQFLVLDPSVNGQIKAFRWRGIDLTEGYYSAWYYFPRDFRVNEWINIMQWKEKESPWDHELAVLAKQVQGIPRFALFWRTSTGEYYEFTNAVVPLGSWVFLEVFIKVDQTQGEVKIWVDGQLSYAKSNIETQGNTPTIMFGVGNYPSQNEYKNLSIYIDDAVASTAYIG
jgi:hypothetical protein